MPKKSAKQLDREVANYLSNTERTIADASDDTIIALDAVEAGNKAAHKLLVGVPCTISIGSDQYSGEIVSATPSLHTIVIAYTGRGGLSGEQRTFRRAKDGRYKSGNFRLSIGTADNYRDPSF